MDAHRARRRRPRHLGGAGRVRVATDRGVYEKFAAFPLATCEGLDALKRYEWPKPSWWRFDGLRAAIDRVNERDARSGALLCGECMAGRKVGWRVFARWSTDIEAYLRARGKPALPAHDPGCAAIAPGGHVLACSDAEGRTAKVSFE